ncbi:MAG: ribokinase [Glaciecola sp.]|jgi:ribokinase
MLSSLSHKISYSTLGVAMAVINFGSINIDHIYTVAHFVTPGETLSSSNYQSVLGGKGANQSIACALANGDVKHVGSVHTNDASFIDILDKAGVNTQFVEKQDSTATGHAIIQVNSDGENAIVLFAGANHQLSTQQIDNVLNSASKDDWVLLQNETNAIGDIIDKASALGLAIAFNPAPMTPNIATLALDKVTLLFVNEIEAMQLTQTENIDDAAHIMREKYPNTKVIMTLGKAGVKYLYRGDEVNVSGFKVDAIDTTAAGDTFTGFFLATYIKNLAANISDPALALLNACAAAALCVTKQGAAPSIPSASEVNNFLAK